MSSQSSPIKPINLLGDEITNIAATNNKKSNNADDDEKMDEMIMQMAEYEVNQDSYRGIKFLGNANDKKVVSPWDICNWGILSLPKSATQQHEDGLLDSKNPTTMVRLLTESCCPSILAWTEQYLEDEAKKSQKTKKRKSSSSTADVPRAHLGKRPLDCHYRCPCDSNPFCLASMGGFMNQLLTERCQNTTAVAIDSDDGDNNDNDLISNKNKRPRSLGLFNSNNKNENSKKHVTCPDTLAHCNDVVDVDVDVDVEAKTESGENSDVFAFMGSDVSNTNKNDVDARTTKVKSSSSSTILTCKRLGPDWSKPAIGDPAEVFLTNEIENQHLNETEYSVTTQDDIDRLRGYQDIDFRDYVKKILEVSNCGKITMDEYIQAIKEWHKSLIFVNPTNCEHDVANDRITIALPPGIQNLGATCYLNTQLQCLAQNPVFLNGIFSWRPVNSSHNMNGVMTKLQKLLAELLVGVDGKYTSLDFSNALGLEHNEQQDPNEFARLLFDRMEESFQQCSSDLGTGGDDLGRLLQRIFHGTTTYETCCMECNKISVRSEGFMDLNLPIVQRQSNEEDETDNSDGSDKIGKDTAAFTKRKRRKQGSIKDAFAKREDTDVQYCLDQYTKAEMLDGENQYFCDYCKCKQNAKRVMKLTELPPVLNIQLSRYVFDREKFVKKKLMDKVRLPTVLNVNRYGGSVSKNKGEPVEKKYILCAVMRHQGTSAYSGHYVAEAMDWTTGQWYEFNDETVKVLSESSSSYVPDNISDDEPIVNGDGLMGNLKSFWNGNQGGNKASTAGSQDAYNMYYVDEEYLAKNAVDTIDRRQSLNANTNHGGFNDDVLSNLIREKEKRYGDLTEMCLQDYVVSDRLRRRKDGIKKYMFVDPSSLLVQEGKMRKNDEPYCWVDGDALRQFLACDRSLDEKLRSNKPIVCPETLLCPHGCLHPRDARRGKLLRKSLYNSYVSLLKAERKFLSETSELEDSDVVGCVITPDEKLSCVECSKQYCNELTNKLEFTKIVNDLYVHMKDKTKLKFVQHEREYLYILSKSAVTAFTTLVDKLKKSTEAFNKGVNLDRSSTTITSANSLILNGIDDIDISSFPGSPTFVDPGSTSKLDEKFNTKFTCPHGNCSEFGLNAVRYVPYKIWAMIKNVFPDAIEHKVLIHSEGEGTCKPNHEHNGCKICRKEKDAIKNLASDIDKWLTNTKKDSVLKKVLDKKRVSRGETVVHNFDCIQNGCRLVHCDDIANFCKSVKSLTKKNIPDTTVDDLKSFVENKAFPSYHSVVLDFEKQPSGKLLQSIRSLICCEHKLAIKSAIVDCSDEDKELQKRHRLSSCVAVLSAEEYNAYISSLTELLSILNCDYQNPRNMDESLQDDTSTLLDEVKIFADSCHPTIEMAVKQSMPSDEVLIISVDGNSKEFSTVPGICDCETCIKEFVPLLQKNDSDVEDIAESVSDDGSIGQKKEMRRSKDHNRGSGALDPILVESDFEDCTELTGDTQKIKVFQYENDSELNDALGSLRSAAGLPSSGETDNGLDYSLRRSKRKRKTLYPIGCITSEETINIGLHHNVAALRMLLFQNCQIPLACKMNIAVTFDDDISPPRGLEIAFDSNTKSLQELIDELKNLDGISDFPTSNPSENIFLLYQNDKDGECGDLEATLMDTLLQMSNIVHPDSDNKHSKGKAKRNRASERGFRGTLLQSSNSSAAENNAQNGATNSSDSSCQIEASTEAVTNKVESRPRSYTVEISEDDIGTESEEENDAIQTKSVHPIITNEASSDFSDGEEVIGRSDGDRKMKFVGKLKEITDSKDESACFEAVSWAMHDNPGCHDDSLIIDAALAKFFDTNPN